jgi:hypothetical protein
MKKKWANKLIIFTTVSCILINVTPSLNAINYDKNPTITILFTHGGGYDPKEN